jgi:sugar phosphate isomerase/epimerase
MRRTGMKKGIRKPVYFPQVWDLRKCFEVASSAGFEGIELIFRSGRGPIYSTTRAELRGTSSNYRSWQSLGASVTFDTTELECRCIKEMAAEHNIMILGLASGYSPIDEPDSPVFVASYNYIVNAIEKTHWLAGENILISFEKSDQRIPDGVVRKWVGELLSRLKVITEDLKVNLAYETGWPAIYETPDELVAMIKAAHSEFIGIYYDPANVLQHIAKVKPDSTNALPAEYWIDNLLPFVKCLHMKDYSFENGFVKLLAGDVNWKYLHRVLSNCNYQGWIVAEIELEPEDHLAEIRQSSDGINSFLYDML